jgi:hypothetical protein
MRYKAYPTYPYLLILLFIAGIAPLWKLRIYPVREPMGLTSNYAVTDISLNSFLIVPRRYKVVIALLKHLFWHLIFPRLHPLLIKIMCPRYLILKVIDIVYNDRFLRSTVKVPYVIYYNIMVWACSVQLQYVTLNSVCDCSRLSVYKNVIIRILIHYPSYWLLYPMIWRASSFGNR